MSFSPLGMPTPPFFAAAVPEWTSYITAQILVSSDAWRYVCFSSAPCSVVLLGGVGLMNGFSSLSFSPGATLPKLPCATRPSVVSPFLAASAFLKNLSVVNTPQPPRQLLYSLGLETSATLPRPVSFSVGCTTLSAKLPLSPTPPTAIGTSLPSIVTEAPSALPASLGSNQSTATPAPARSSLQFLPCVGHDQAPIRVTVTLLSLLMTT